MFSPAQPTLLIIPGAGHGASYWSDSKNRLEALSYEVICHSLPSLGDASKSWYHDRDFLLGVIEPEMDKGKEIVVVAHSYGSLPGIAICQGQSLQERADKGKIGGILSIILVAAGAVTKKGFGSLGSFHHAMQTGSDAWPPYLEPKPDGLAHSTSSARSAFYSDISDEEAVGLMADLKPTSTAALTEPMDQYAGEDLTIPSFYMICSRDLAIPPDFQHFVCDHIPGMKGRVFDSGHSPYLSIPDQFVGFVDECAHVVDGTT